MSVLGPLICPVLVGRDEFVELTTRRLDEAATGHGQLLLFAGEAGIGKSRLIDAVLRSARAVGFKSAKGDVAPQDRFVPTSVILDVARTARRIPAFGTLGDDLLTMRADHDRDDVGGSRRVFVIDIVERIAASVDGPTLLVFEDLQWADELSLEIIGELARVARELPLLLVGAYRTDELPTGSILREWRARLIGQRLAEEARLTPLTLAQTALVTTLILDTGLPAPREVVAAVFERTDGIPLHIEELLGALSDDARRSGREIRNATVPETIEDAILGRLARFSPETRAVAQAGAVIGRCFIPQVLAGIMNRPVDELDQPLRELVDGAILGPMTSDGYFDFRHQLLRDAVYRSVPAAQVRVFHARTAEFGAHLEGASEIHASAHFERAGLREEAYRAALAGAREASRLSSRRESFELYRRAGANLPPGVPAVEVARLFEAYCEAARAVEELGAADDAARRARQEFLTAGLPIEAARMFLTFVSLACRELRPMADRLALTTEALDELSALPIGTERDQALADTLIWRAIVLTDMFRLDEARVDVERARSLAVSADAGEFPLAVTCALAEIDILSGRIGPGLDRALWTAREARDAGFEDAGLTAYRDTVTLATQAMRYDLAEVALREGLRFATTREQSHCRHVMAATSTLMDWAAGRWDEAVASAGLELVERGCLRGAVVAGDALGLVAMGRGDLETAREHLEPLLTRARESEEPRLVLTALWGLAEADLLASDPVAAIDRCDLARGIASDSGERALFVPFVVTGVRAYLAVNHPEQAERWFARAAEHLAGWDDLGPAATDHARGLLRLAAGATGAARDALEAAVRGWDQRGRIWEGTWARLDLIHCLLRSNRLGQAATLLAVVRAAGERLGSAPLLARADELERAGRGRQGLDEPWRPLTAREFEVARLIAAGMTNAEIADELGIAPKTASAHVEHILAKLGATRRAEIAAWTMTVGRDNTSRSAGPVSRPESTPPDVLSAPSVRQSVTSRR